ncbi:DNA polymerase III subunit gamma/tau [Marinicella gelatinilytica]|uniref:DNA polymerase III subunit gamma/tau n=1 Tax=Marinicella gelatinilytica TaxID=2996017 RepID=UPI002261037D|nr:DNA polymerase III subunit gamma/tau [Marinicella gelatinilytica]MCX7546278.1 DNA polymerase III subunit gamma/tau [Marinicella gelatinilytica]
MTYQVLARKHRPQNFKEVVGQEHVVQALVNGLDNNRLHHAFLFTGTRGVGKTTLARVLAKSLNCLEGVGSEPCGQCIHCLEIQQGEFIDLIEVDAASRTGVDDTRSLLDNVSYAPNKGQYKIYLIDEVHMFSKSSFNALLKTLEEPPEHVKFLLATTEPEKLPITVLSRCLQFNLKRLTEKQISDYLAEILQRESLDYEDKAIQLVARVADGSMRDALSLLDQSLAFGGNRLNYDEVRTMLGTVEQSHVVELLNLIIAGDKKGVVDKLDWFHAMSIDYSQLLEELSRLLHEVALTQSLNKVTGGGAFDVTTLKNLANNLAEEVGQLYYQFVVVGLQQMRTVPDKKISFEMTIIRMLDFDINPGKREQLESSQVSTKTVSDVESSQKSQSVDNAKMTHVKSPKVVEAEPKPQAELTNDYINLSELNNDNWPEIFKDLPLKGMPRELARNLMVLENTNNTIIFALDASVEPFKTPTSVDKLAQVLAVEKQNYRLEFTIRDQVSSVAKKQADADRQTNQQRQQDRDPVVDALQERFDATIINQKKGQ